MNRTDSDNSQLSTAPLGAGDLIDRSVRFYRKNFWTFIFIASPPIIIGAVFLIGWMILARNIFSVDSANPDEATFYSMFVVMGGMVIWFIQLVAIFVVMGGASRNFVRHILFGEAITFGQTYNNVKSRLGGLIVISSILVFLLSVFGIILFYTGMIVAFIPIAGIFWLLESVPILAVILSIAVGLAVLYGTFWLFFLITSRFVYVPQVMLVEGQGAFAAIGRSTSLAGKNVKRVGSLFIFTLVVTISAVTLLYVPLLIYSYMNGIDILGLQSADLTPAWIEIAEQVISEFSLILLTPILMIGLCLLYVDERVKSEGYDIELMAAKRLGAIPSVPQKYVNPLQPAISTEASVKNKLTPKPSPPIVDRQVKTSTPSNSILNLD